MRIIAKSCLFAATAVLIALSAKPANAWFKVCNRSGERANVAFAYLDRNDNRDVLSSYNHGWVSEGWWILDSGQCTQVYPHELWRRNSYFYVYAYGNSLTWSGNHSFCTIRSRFKLANADKRCSGSGRTWKNFDEVIVGPRTQNYTYTLAD
jgi:uncharacterized membrane protein